MALSITERMATGWFLTINNAERKKLTVFEVRCSHGGCLLAAVVTIDKELYIPGVTDSTKTETHPTALRDVPPEAMLRMLGIDYQPLHPEAYLVASPQRRCERCGQRVPDRVLWGTERLFNGGCGRC